MSDSLTRGFRAQLTISMDAALRRAVFEIMNIFENTIDDCRMELAHKGEEVSQLKMKLQTAELMLKDQVYGKNGGQEIIQASNHAPKPPEATTQTPKQPTDVSQIHVDVPEELCEPLNSETVTIQDDASPDVKLRQFSIPLWNIPIRKTEGGYCDIGSHFKIRNSKRFAGSRDLNIISFGKVPVPNLKQEPHNQSIHEGLRRSKRMSVGEVKKQAVKRKRKGNVSKAVESRSTEVNTVEKNAENLDTCKICPKVFETDFDLQAHKKLHQKCRGCKKIFPSKKLLIRHKKNCKKSKRESAATTSPSKHASEGENMHNASKKPETFRKESQPVTVSNLSTEKYARTKIYCCPHCEKPCISRLLLKKHILHHRSKWSTHCSLCSMMFRSERGVKIHMTKAHDSKMNECTKNDDLAWTEPIEEIDNETQDLISIRTESSQESNPNNKEKQHSVINVELGTMEKNSRRGLSCLLCMKLFQSKCALIEHMDVHK